MKKLSIALLAGLGGTAHANGYLLNEFDAKAVGRGNASSATDTDPSSIYYNIGGLAVAEDTHVMIGGSVVSPSVSFKDSLTNTRTDSTTSPKAIPGIFVSSRVAGMVSVGLGVYTPFGLALDWPDNAPTNDVVRSETLRTYFITPSVGVNLGSFIPGLSVGGGIDFVPATVELYQTIFLGPDTGNAHLGANAFGVGGRIGVMYKPHSLPRLSLGAMWRSEVKEDFSGHGDFDAPAPFRSLLPADGIATTSATLPQQVTGGVAYRPIDNLELEANVIWTAWSAFKSLDITVPTAGNGTMTISSVQNWEDKVTVRAGVEYDLPAVGVGLRAGYIYDPTPIKAQYLTALLPDVDRNDVTVGGSKSFGDYDFHAGMLWVLPTSRTTAPDMNLPQHKGTYDVSAFVFSFTVGYKFGATK